MLTLHGPCSIAILGVAVLAWSAGALALVDPGIGDSTQVEPIVATDDPGAVAVDALHATGTRNVQTIGAYGKGSRPHTMIPLT